MPSAEKIHELLAKCDRARDGAIQSARRIVKRGLAQSLERFRGATNNAVSTARCRFAQVRSLSSSSVWLSDRR